MYYYSCALQTQTQGVSFNGQLLWRLQINCLKMFYHCYTIAVVWFYCILVNKKYTEIKFINIYLNSSNVFDQSCLSLLHYSSDSMWVKTDHENCIETFLDYHLNWQSTDLSERITLFISYYLFHIISNGVSYFQLGFNCWHYS